MAQAIDSDNNSNSYFFLTNYSEGLGAGRNSFVLNPTQLIMMGQPIFVKAYDVDGNELPCGEIKPTNAAYAETTNTGKFYYVNVFEDTPNGIGKLEVRGIYLVTLDYTGSIAYYNGKPYKVSDTQRLPLTSAPSSDNLIPTDVVLWTRNVLIDTTRKTDSEVRFFSSPQVKVRPELHAAPVYPTGSYSLATGTFSSIAVDPKHNDNGDYDYQFDEPIYQLFRKSGEKFNYMMEGNDIRIKNLSVTKFKYSDYSDVYQGTLNTDFIAKIKKVVNENTILLDIPFMTVAEILNNSNEDSPYTKNNLTEIKGFTINDDPKKQTVYHKNNFYILSLTDGEFEIFYNNIPVEIPRNDASGSAYVISVLNMEYNNIRTLCGALDSYKIYGKSLNSPESKMLLVQGKIEPDSAIKTNKFNNGFFSNPAHFYNQSFLSSHWFSKGGCSFYQSNSVLMNGAVISHGGNDDLSDYVIFKDNTDPASQNYDYNSYNLVPKSYWYANADAFVSYTAYPTASYLGISGIPSLSSYAASQENLTSGIIYDSNSIKVRQNTLYKYSIKVKADPNNNVDSKLYTYYISGNNKKMIGYIDNSFNYGANEAYENTFFCEQEAYGTIILVPVRGSWNISNIILEPYMNVDYSIDSFAIKVPIKTAIPNEYYELETELYDAQGRLAYGKNSYTFTYNKKFLPLKKNIFIDPVGTSVTLVIDGGFAGSY